MRYSTIFAGLVAVVAAAPIDLPTLPVVGDVKLPTLPVVGDLKLPAVPEVPELPVELPVRRAVTDILNNVSLEKVEELIPSVDGLVRRVAVTVDEQKVISVVENVVELLSELIHVDGLPAVASLPKRATIDVDEQRVIAVVEDVIQLLSELINVDANVPAVPALPVKRATITVGEDKVISTVQSVIGELSELIHVKAPIVDGEMAALPVAARQLLDLPVLSNVDVITTVTQVIGELTGLLAL